MKHFITAAVLGAAVVVAAGCGDDSGTPSVPRTTAAAEAPDPTVELERAAKRAIDENLRVSQYAGRHGRVPSWALRSTRGAALENLRASTVENVREGIRVTSLGATTVSYQAIRFDPSYGSATVSATLRERVRLHRRGRRAPRVLAYTERARIQLDRVGRSDPPRFVVTRITVLR